MTMVTTNVKTDISVAALQELLEKHEDVVVLDVRAAADRAEWHIPGSSHLDVYQRLKSGDQRALDEFDADPATPIVTVCGKGETSRVAAEQLRARGFSARSLAGGMNAWSLAWNTALVPLHESRATVIQVRRTGKGCLSYLIGSRSEALVIDPSLAPEVYLELAAEQGWSVTYTLDTHIHADHLSRGLPLAQASGGAYYAPANDRLTADFTPLADGEEIAFGFSRLRVIAAPGHTPESVVYQLDDRALFTGDTLFLTSVGRPDLEADPAGARERARWLWRSLQRIAALPGETVILPGHISEPVPFDGEPISALLDAVRDQVPPLALTKSQFVETILGRLPPTPPNHAAIVALNETGSPPDGDPTDLEAGANRCAIS
jgi:glyoxylase-like metal-dependent hydrolase (beta-lactamase superfamily II)/rhodanese-related sulfurtransferase